MLWGIHKYTSDTLVDVFLGKLDDNGNLLWSQTFGGVRDQWPGGFIFAGSTCSGLP